MPSPKSLVKPAAIMWSVALGLLGILTALAAISLMGTKASGKFVRIANTAGASQQTPPATEQPLPVAPSTPAASEPAKGSQ